MVVRVGKNILAFIPPFVCPPFATTSQVSIVSCGHSTTACSSGDSARIFLTGALDPHNFSIGGLGG